jgi:hypothetical protein
MATRAFIVKYIKESCNHLEIAERIYFVCTGSTHSSFSPLSSCFFWLFSSDSLQSSLSISKTTGKPTFLSLEPYVASGLGLTVSHVKSGIMDLCKKNYRYLYRVVRSIVQCFSGAGEIVPRSRRRPPDQ